MKKSSRKIRTKYTINQSEKRTTVKIHRSSDQSHELQYITMEGNKRAPFCKIIQQKNCQDFLSLKEQQMTSQMSKKAKHESKDRQRRKPANPHGINECFSFNNYSWFLVTIFSPIAWLHFLHINPHTTHSSNSSDEWLKLETSAFKLFTAANLRLQLS